MKKALSIIVVVFLVVALVTTGVFALTSNTAPDFLWGVDIPSFTQFGTTNYGELLFSFTIPDNFNVSYTANEYYPIFNNVSMKYRLSGNGTRYLFDISTGSQLDSLSWSSVYPATFDVYRLNVGGNDGIYCTLHGNPLDRTNGILLSSTSSLSPSVSFGSSWVWDNLGLVGEVFKFTLSPGYALVINGPCEVLDRTYSISGSWNFDRLTNSRINGSFERVVQTSNLIDGFSPDRYLTIEQLLPWWADNSNALGVASNYSYHNTDVVNLSDGGINYVLGYPVYYQGSGDYSISHENAVSLTGSIYFQYSGTRPTISKIAIESLAEIVEGHYHYYNVFRPDVYDETGDVVSDGSGGTVVEFPEAPSGGGNSGQPPVNEETNLFGVLSKFVNDIKNLISQGSHAISELVNYGSSFMHSIAQMYDWLPATLTTLIVTAFSIVLVIGVIKLLWK